LHTNKSPERKILVRHIKRTEDIYALPPEVVFATSASNIAGGTLSIKRAITLMHDLSEEELDSSGLSRLIVKVDDVYKKLDDIHKDNRRVLGIGERLKGDLIPKVVKEYYEAEEYRAKEADENIDKEFKIDLIAEKNNEIRAIQVKKGTVSSQEIHEICEKASAYFKQKISNQRVKIIEIIAQHFPNDYLQMRDEFMKKQNEVTLSYKHFYQITQKLPKYRYIRMS